MVTFNITNRYSNIPHESGKQAISSCIEKYTKTLHSRFNKKIITDGIELILNNSSFQFYNNNCIKTLGTVIGSKIAPTYDTLIVA